MNQEIYLVGLNHKTAGVDIRERFALPDCDPAAKGLVSDTGVVSEAMILSTCNRVEFLVVGESHMDIRTKILRFWADHCGQPVADLENHTYCHIGDGAVNHLFTVASSLDSMILGEPQILGQLKTAYRNAVEKGVAKVIVLGRPVGNMSVGEYIRYKPQIFETIAKAYDDLAAARQVMVLEGAGSPAEVNLKSHDVVNMRMARHAGARVLLAGDIDRGGVFASFVGTMEVMEEWERAMVAGFVVNRFRGKRELLGDAIDYVRRYTGVETLGVVPYLANLGLPEEDSVTFKESRLRGGGGDVLIAAVDLPHISNFTDLDALGLEPDVKLRIARRPEDLEGADAVILPGSRNVFADLEYLWKSGLAQAVLAARAEIIGVCGGLQMLGKSVTDPAGVESGGIMARPLALLPLATEMAPDKVLCQARGHFLPTGEEVRGYEIHHGVTRVLDGPVRPAMSRLDGTAVGWGREDGMVWGTYLHGVFDADGFRRSFLDRLRVRKGLEPLRTVQVAYDLEAALDRLAAVVRGSLDMERIHRLLD